MSYEDSLYNDLLAREIGDIASVTQEVKQSIYEGEQAFALMMYCIKPDTPPPPSANIHNGDGSSYFYKIKIANLDHDMLMLILTSIRDIFPVESPSVEGSRSRLRQELQTLGISHMQRWITTHKDRSYTLEIRYLSSLKMRTLCKILFSW